MIDRMTDYLLTAERCAIKLRSFDQSRVKPLWDQVLAAFMADPIKYPSAMAADNDTKGRKEFLAKCQMICFPPASKEPRDPEE
jgi:hypothetical protein